MADYREWCRLCGALEASVEVSSDTLQLIENVFEVILQLFEASSNLLIVKIVKDFQAFPPRVQ